MLGCPRGSASSARLFVPGERLVLQPRGMGKGRRGEPSRDAGEKLWGWLGGDRSCPSVLLRAWAAGVPGRLFALDPLLGGEKKHFWSVESPVNMTKEDGDVDLCPASRRAGCNRALSQP